mgnify:CR=1 FL=1
MDEQWYKPRCTAIHHLLKTFPREAMGDSVEEQTPSRVAKMYSELLKGYDDDPQAILSKQFDVQASAEEDTNGIVVVKDIPFYSQCEHHLVPFFGIASIAYLPKDKVVGLSKFARLVECYARRLQVQERMTKQIIDDITHYLDPQGAMVVIEAEHLCMTMRGIQKPGAKTITSRITGVFADSSKARQEALALMGRG